MELRIWSARFARSASLDQMQHGISTCGKFVWRRWPEILLAISAGGLAYKFWSMWQH
jgi:hypothetical protein